MLIESIKHNEDGSMSAIINANEVSYRNLIRFIRKIPNTEVKSTSYDPLNDNTQIIVNYKNTIIEIDTPLSDYIINCESDVSDFEEFIMLLQNQKVRWWQRLF